MRGIAGWFKVGTVCCLLSVVGCDSGNKNEGHELEGSTRSLRGRAFSSDTGKPLTDALVTIGGSSGNSDGEGAFTLSYSSSAKDRDLQVNAKEYAPVRKSVPAGDGYVEVFAKSIDAKETVAPDKDGVVKSDKGASLEIKAGSLETKDGKSPKEIELAVAAPDAKRATDLDALPGDFAAKQGDVIGKVSASAPVYIDASEKGQELNLKAGQKANVTLPASGKKKAAQPTLYRFDEVLGLWLEAGPAVEGLDGDGLPVFSAEVDRFGWFTVGTFIGELSCIRTCVVHENQTPVPFARAVVTGVDLFTQSVAFAGADGCLALSVPANARLTLSVQSEGARAAPQVVQSTTGGNAAQPDTCLQLPPVVLAASQPSTCPLGFASCGDSCVDIARDPANCGGCGQSCGTNLCAGARCVDLGATGQARRWRDRSQNRRLHTAARRGPRLRGEHRRLLQRHG
ncbi:MAG: hypothetical protein QM778_09740 [Myxococcales bacterium]